MGIVLCIGRSEVDIVIDLKLVKSLLIKIHYRQYNFGMEQLYCPAKQIESGNILQRQAVCPKQYHLSVELIVA